MKYTKLTALIPAFFLLSLSSLSSFAANCNISWASTSVSVTTELAFSSYSLTSNTICGGGGGIGSSGIPIGNLVTINFPAGTDASTITTGTFNGSVISFILLNPTQITFNAPANAAKGTSCTVILNNITNPSAGTYTALNLSAVNNSGGTTSFSNSNYTITPLPPMTYSSSITTQSNTSDVALGTIKNEVIGIEIVTTGTASPIDATSFSFNTGGTTNPVTDIVNAKLWYTGTNNSFTATNQFGATNAAPNGGYIVTGTQTLSVGTNYFWLTYEVPFTSTSGNFIDAECNSIIVDAIAQNPTTTAPAGNREIILQNTFYMTYDKGASFGEGGLIPASDGGYVTLFTDWSTGTFGGADFLLLKIDAAGNSVWSKYYGGAGSDEAFSIATSSDGGYIFGGNSWHTFKVNSLGTIEWSDYYSVGVLNDIEQTSDGGYILFGSGGNAMWDFYLVKINSTGTIIWDQQYSGANSDRGEIVHQTADGGYILGGIVDWSNPANTGDIVLVKTNSTGTTSWMKRYQIGASLDELSALEETSDGGYIISGQTNSLGAGNSDSFLIKIDATGNVEWANTYGGTGYDYTYGMTVTTDGGYALTGYTTSFGHGGSDNWLLKINSTGILEWSRAFGQAASDFGAKGIIQASDGGFLLDGSYGFVPALLKTNEQGFTECNVMDVTQSITKTSITPVVTDPTAYFTIASPGLPDYSGAGDGELAVVTNENILCQQVVLPIELVSFTGENKGNYNLLEWKTSTEINNDFFTIERSIDAINFDAIGTVSGAGNSNTMLSYSTSDDNPYPLTYYRLKQTDFDGRFEYSQTISITNKELYQINVYPNPFKNNFTIQLPTKTSSPINIEVTDYLGRNVFSKVINDEDQQIDISLGDQFSTGTYFVKVFNDTEQTVKKIMKLN